MNTNKLKEAKQSLDKVIDKARVHLYKPIQIAEILYRDRVDKDINLNNLSTYRTISKKWRDVISLKFLGRTSTSSARYQDDIFNENAIPPSVLTILGKENRIKNGIVEAYIYKKFEQRLSQMATGINYCSKHTKFSFQLNDNAQFIRFQQQRGYNKLIDQMWKF